MVVDANAVCVVVVILRFVIFVVVVVFVVIVVVVVTYREYLTHYMIFKHRRSFEPGPIFLNQTGLNFGKDHL